MRLRRLRAEDTERVQEFVRRLSARSRLERFFAPVTELSPKQLARITSGSGLSLAAKLGFGLRRDADPRRVRFERPLAGQP